MQLIEFIKLPENSIFLISIILILVMALVEAISMMLGVSISEALDNILPDVEIDVETDLETSISSPILDWLNFGKVPFLILIILFFTFFGLTGFIIQGIVYNYFNTLLSLFIVVPLSIILAVYLSHLIGKIINKILPQVDTTAIKLSSLKGEIAEINIGTARVNNPAEAKVKDKYGKTHYVRVIPGDKNEEFIKGEKVVLNVYSNGIFEAEKIDLDLL